MARQLIAAAVLACCGSLPAQAAPATAHPAHAIVTTEAAVLRAAPRESGQHQAQLWPGELLEVRGERLDWLQVWDYRRERGGYVRASQVQRTALAAGESPELLAVLRFVREQPGAETLGIGLAAAWLRAAPAEALRGEPGAEVLDALGTLADRLAHRASSGAALSKPAQAKLSAHLDVAARYGVGFTGYEREGRMQVCYDGDAFRRVLAMPSQPAQRARAALALTRPECLDPALRPLERHQRQRWRAEVLDQVDTAALAGPMKVRVQLRRAMVWSSVAYGEARLGGAGEALSGIAPAAAAERALAEFAAVDRGQLPEEEAASFNDAAMRVNASRWAAVPQRGNEPNGQRPAIVTAPGQAGETCVLLVDAKNAAERPLARRCTYSLVWPQSASLNREGNALALAVQPLEGWRELWVFRKQAGAWTIEVLPPATVQPELGYAEFAGWVPGGKQLLVAREARGEGKYKRSYELVRLDTLTAERQSADPASLGVFQRWQDPAWKRLSVSIR